MPNGHPNWEKKKLPQLEKFFSRISGVLEAFAKTYNLTIEKYYHQGPSWVFVFRHPKSGNGQIEVEKAGDDSVVIRPSWYLDDYDNNTRWLKYPEGQEYSLDETILRNVLNKSLKEVISWERKELKPLKSRYYTWNKKVSKKKFEEQQNKYPIPRL